MLDYENFSENNNYEGFRIVTEKPVKIRKEEFFKYLRRNNSLNLTIVKLANTKVSKFDKTDKKVKESGFFIIYHFKLNNKKYETKLWYNMGVPVSPETFLLNDKMEIFKILAVAIDLSNVEDFTVTKEFLEKELTGLKFKCTFKRGYKIKPVRRL